MLAIAIEAARTAGKFLRQNVGKIRSIQLKGGESKNLVTEIDKRSEEMIISLLKRHYPGHEILAEEGGMQKTGNSDYRWVIDPLDGTTNFTHGFPVYCVSIGLERRGEVILGVIYDPNHDELFTAEKGKGAFLNGKQIRVSAGATLERGMLVTGFPYNIAENPNRAIERFISFLMKAQAVRRMGSAAIDLAYVAAGRYEGFWEVDLNPWDMAAGTLLVTEAGGKVTSFDGGDFSIYRKDIIASNGLVHEEMLALLRSVSGG
ncbi:MAG TPA: inositol monophosphatase family protein [Bacteroidota bacterium]|nr:inositol monophosphatase family protein [Bacteroidota bacterium]